MRKRYLVLGLSVFLAIALTVPALGGPSNPVAGISASAKKTAKKALKKAKNAQNTANNAQNAANGAQNSADDATAAAANAQTTADGAQTSATNAQTAADAAQATANSKLGSVRQVTGSTTGGAATTKTSQVACDGTGEVLSGGGLFMGGADVRDAAAQDSFPYITLWTSRAHTVDFAGAGNTWTVTAEAICLSP